MSSPPIWGRGAHSAREFRGKEGIKGGAPEQKQQDGARTEEEEEAFREEEEEEAKVGGWVGIASVRHYGTDAPGESATHGCYEVHRYLARCHARVQPPHRSERKRVARTGEA